MLKEIFWTNHAKEKMRYYGFSESRIKRVLHTPTRIEDGIAPDTMAFMQTVGSKTKPKEFWVMVSDEGNKRKVISAWRYPGETKPQSDKTKEILRAELNEFFEKGMEKFK